jgi:2Fe-2S ferredoxin
VIEAAWRNGYSWPSICNGQGMCKTCVFMVVQGGESLSSIKTWEQEGLDSIARGRAQQGEWRLACQARVDGDVYVRKIGVKPVASGSDERTGGDAR